MYLESLGQLPCDDRQVEQQKLPDTVADNQVVLLLASSCAVHFTNKNKPDGIPEPTVSFGPFRHRANGLDTHTMYFLLLSAKGIWSLGRVDRNL